MPIPQEQEIFHLEVDDAAKSYMLETVRWTKFLAIIGFIAMGLFVVLAIVVGFALSNSSAFYGTGLQGAFMPFLSLIYLIIPAIYFYPTWALLKFSKHTKRALITVNQEELIKGLKYQKNLFRYIGILMIIVLAFYGLAIAIAILVSAMR